MPLLQEVGATPSTITNTNVVFPNNTVAGGGSLLIAGIRTGLTITLNSVTDNQGGTWTLLPAVDSSPARDYIAYRFNAPSNVAVTVTFAFGAANSPQIVMAEFSTVLTTSPLDQTSAGATGTSTTATSDNVTTTHSNELLVGFISMGTNETFSQHGSWSIALGNGAPTARAVLVYQEVTATGTYAAAVDATVGIAWIAQTITFQEAGGAAPPQMPFVLRHQDVWHAARDWAVTR